MLLLARPLIELFSVKCVFQNQTGLVRQDFQYITLQLGRLLIAEIAIGQRHGLSKTFYRKKDYRWPQGPSDCFIEMIHQDFIDALSIK